jgi:probable rRNA maturation factor
MSIAIDVEEPFAKLVAAERLQAALAAALAFEQASGDVTLLVTDDATIADLNRRFLGVEGPTDVLSFPARDEPDSPFTLPPDIEPYLGEMELLAIHGALHLLGYDHDDPATEAGMWARQDAILRTLGEK